MTFVEGLKKYGNLPVETPIKEIVDSINSDSKGSEEFTRLVKSKLLRVAKHGVSLEQACEYFPK